MISNRPGVCVRFFVAGAVAFGSLVSPTWAGAQAAPFGSSQGVFRPMAGSVGGLTAEHVAAGTTELPPTATISERPTGAIHERFEITITFSEIVDGFTLSDVRITNGRGIDFVGGDATRVFTFTLLPLANFQGEVLIRIPSAAAVGGTGNSSAASHDFEVDNRAPRATRASVNRRTLTIEFDEDLDEAVKPDASAFRVDVIDTDNDVTRAVIDDIDVEGEEVIVTLATGVRHDDFIELRYRNDGANALRDPTGNLAEEFGVEVAVRNVTVAGAGAPGAPTDLEADPDGATAIDLDWTAPANHGDDAITGYRIEVSTDGGGTWSDLVADTELTTTTYRHAGLAAGDTRHYRVSAINSLGAGLPSNVASATTISRVPGPPTRLTARATGRTTITLTWRSPTSGTAGPITGYLIEVANRSTGPWTVLEGDTRSRSTTYVHRGLSSGTTRYYRVSAINTAGSGRLSNVADAMTDAAAPDAPTNLQAVASGAGGSREILLTWARPSHDGGRSITGYRIEVSPNGFSGWTALVANTSSPSTRYTHSNLTPGSTRHYRVAAINALGTGAFSNVAAGRTNAAPPSAPGGLRARADGPNSIALSWDPPLNTGGAPVAGYRIWRSGSAQGTFIVVQNNTGTTATTFRDTNLLPATTYRYQVAAINSVGAGQRSAAASTTTHAAVPGAPGSLTARAVGTSRIDLSWRAPTNTGGAAVLGYRIEVSRDAGANWIILRASTGSTATSFSHTGLQPGNQRHYRVSAINSAGIGAPSRVARATTEAVLPGAPTGVMARADGSTAIELSWNPPISDGGARIAGYRIEASRNQNSGWVVIRANTRSSATTYRHTNLFAGSTWYYRISAINSKGTGPASRVARGMTDAIAPGQPQGLRAAAEGPNAIRLTWQVPTDIGGAMITGYRIEVAPDSRGPWVALVADSRSTVTTYTHTGLPPVTTRFYRVSAINAAGIGRPTTSVSATTLPDVPAAPTGLTASPQGTSRIDLSWRAPANDGGSRVFAYRVEVSSDGGATWRILRRNTGSTATTFSHTNLQPASTRFYRVSAINLAGTGRPSNIARATTEATVPNAPRNLSAGAIGTSQIDLSWGAPTANGGALITGYRIEVSEDAGANWRILVANSRNISTRYSHADLSPASTRHYRVSAINRIGVGRASSVASATTDATVPDAPTGLTALATSPTQIDLTWSAPAYDGGAQVSGYRIEVSEDGTNWRDLVRNSGSTGTSYSHTGLLPGSRRSYRVSAINAAGTGAPSGIASAATDDPVERAGRLNTTVLPHVAAAMTSSTVSAIADRIDAVASGMGRERRMEMGGLSSMAASFSSPRAVTGLGRRDRSGAALLFGGSSFQTAPSGASQMATWGAGEYQHLGEPGASALDWSGNMVSAHVGADARVASDILAGIAASYSTGTFDFTDRTGANPVTGTYGTAMTSVNPYVAWFSGDRGNAAWATGGYGFGDVEVEDAREALRTSPARMLTGAAGGSYQVLETGIGGVRVKAEGWAGRVMVDGGERIDSVTLDMQRAKLALEWTQGYRSSGGNEIAIVLEGGMRYDNGDGVNGTSGEVGGGLRYSNAGLGLMAEGRGRLLISAREGYEEWGFGGMIQFDPAVRGQGLSIRVAPSYGDAASGVNQLWDQGVSDAVRGRDMPMRANVNGEVAYGVAGFQGTPYGGFYLADGGARAFSSGLRYDLGSGLGLRIEGTRREAVLGGAGHSVGIRGRLRFR